MLASMRRLGHRLAMTDFPKPHFVDANGVRLAVHEKGNGAPVVLVHGWPEMAYSWKHQMTALAGAGYRAIAPDLRGFGASDAPKDRAAYDIVHLTDDLVAILDALDIEKAVFCGHDWGGVIVWPFAMLHPDRVAGVIGVCTAHRPPLTIPPIKIIEKFRGPKHYIVQFQEEGGVEALFTGEEDKFFRIMFQKAPKREILDKMGHRIFDLPGRFQHGPTPEIEGLVMGPADLQVYVDAYKASGFHGGINLYRNIDRDHEILRDVDPVIPAPSLWIGADDDAFLPVEAADGMEQWAPDLEKHTVADCGHWM
ncbi:MAG: alpha/beta hydrolase, partial [Pseudomonadota bacterium]